MWTDRMMNATHCPSFYFRFLLFSLSLPLISQHTLSLSSVSISSRFPPSHVLQTSKHVCAFMPALCVIVCVSTCVRRCLRWRWAAFAVVPVIGWSLGRWWPAHELFSSSLLICSATYDSLSTLRTAVILLFQLCVSTTRGRKRPGFGAHCLTMSYLSGTDSQMKCKLQ